MWMERALKSWEPLVNASLFLLLNKLLFYTMFKGYFSSCLFFVCDTDTTVELSSLEPEAPCDSWVVE